MTIGSIFGYFDLGTLIDLLRLKLGGILNWSGCLGFVLKTFSLGLSVNIFLPSLTNFVTTVLRFKSGLGNLFTTILRCCYGIPFFNDEDSNFSFA